jgi:hypothetical protein
MILPLLLAPHARAQAPASSGGGVGPAYRVLRTVSGTRGEVRNGQYVVLDPRTEFQVPADAQVIVFFEWLGAPGAHKLSGTWHGPSDTRTTTAFDYTAQDRQFGAYWVLTLPATIPPGDWRLDASIDGQPAGSHAFRILSGSTPAGAPASPRRLPLTRQELYERGLAALVTVEALDAAGAKLQSGLGIAMADGHVLTSFSAVNMASRLRIRTRGGGAVDADSLSALSYRGGWAIIPVPALPGVTPLVPAVDPLRVGAPCFSFDSPGDGTYVIAPGEVSGLADRAGPDARLSLSLSGLAAPGAPLLNEFGELAGVIPSNIDARDNLRTALTVGAPSDRSTAVPLAALPAAPAQSLPLAQVASTNGFVQLVTASRQVLNGGFAVRIEGKGPSARPVDQRTDFDRKDPGVVTFVTWLAKERFKGTSTARLYDMSNRLLGESKPAKTTLRANDLLLSSWRFPVPPPGAYRVDVLLGDAVAWRGHFAVTE